MKHFLCYDHTEDSENLIPDGQEFLVEKPPEELYAKLEKAVDKELDRMLKVHFNIPLFLAAILSGGIAYIILSVFFTEILKGNVALIQAITNAPLLFVGGCLALIICIISAVAAHKKNKADKEKAEQFEFKDSDIISAELLRTLGVPDGLGDTEILSFNYIYNGEECVPTADEFGETYFTECYCLFTDSENLYLVRTDGKYSIPLSSLRGIRKVYTEITLACWSRDESRKAEDFARYEITEAEDESITMPYHYSLDFDADGESWQLYFPSFELPTFEKLTGLSA